MQKLTQCNFSYDALTIYDGSTNTSPTIGKYCGDSLPSSQISSSNEVFMHFHTDSRNTKKGFKLAYHPWSKSFPLTCQILLQYICVYVPLITEVRHKISPYTVKIG